MVHVWLWWLNDSFLRKKKNKKDTFEEWQKNAKDQGWPLRWFPQWDKCMGAWPFSNLWNLRVLSLMMHRHRWGDEMSQIWFKHIYESNKRTVGRHPEFASTDGQTCRNWSRYPLHSTAERIFPSIQNISKHLELHAEIVWCHLHPILSSSPHL